MEKLTFYLRAARRSSKRRDEINFLSIFPFLFFGFYNFYYYYIFSFFFLFVVVCVDVEFSQCRKNWKKEEKGKIFSICWFMHYYTDIL